MSTRADLIFEILKKSKTKLKVSALHTQVAKIEKVKKDDLNQSIVPATVRQDNKIRSELGRAKRFNIYGDGTEARGYISLYAPATGRSNKKDIIEHPETGVPSIIQEVNEKVRNQLEEALAAMSWREFETNFLPSILESLGFHAIQITQPTRDGGKDAVCAYQRGIVKSQAIISAKHWGPQQTVPVSEVQRLRGLKGDSDTGIIITTAKFSKLAITEATPSQNQRSIVLIDGEMILDICLEKSLGVREMNTPKLYGFVGFDNDTGD